MTDSHIRRGGDDYAQAMAAGLPTGAAWPRDPESPLLQFVAGLAQIWGDVDGRAADLLERETDPRLTSEMLSDWEAAFGLPDDCMGPATTIEERRTRLMARMTMLGGQSRAFFIALAAALGYTITIDEFSPVLCGVSECGSDAWCCGAPETRFYWVVNVYDVPVWWFRGGVGECGKDHHAEWAAIIDLECLIRRYKPAHTVVLFGYNN
jgi:uncharacterized protein YmfQ (DUF2313 family)